MGVTTEDLHGETKEMLLQSVLSLTDNRKRMALLTFLTFVTLC